jgi:hypothetical protein
VVKRSEKEARSERARNPASLFVGSLMVKHFGLTQGVIDHLAI